MKILCDQMLGSLAKWLRLLGIDTYYATAEISDDELLEIALKEKRMIISRDKELVQRAQKQNITVVELQTTDLDQQLTQVTPHISIENNEVLSRCTLCNSLLISIGKEELKEKIPPRVYEHHTRFWYCPRCEKYYWMGNHYQKIIEKISTITGKS